MTVQNKYTNSKINGTTLNQLLAPWEASAGNGTFVASATFEVAAADDDGSIFRLFKNVSPNLIPIRIGVSCDAITGGTDWVLGLYKPELGAVLSANCLMTTQTLASAAPLGSGALNGLKGLDVANVNQRIFEIAGHTISNKLDSYDIALTANTIGTAAGTVTVVMEFQQG